jgi:predicted nucleic acid-binding protein
VKLFVDTWGWLAISDEDEEQHARAAQCYTERLGSAGPVVTSDYVLDETFTAVFLRHPFAQARQFCQAVLELCRGGAIGLEAVDGDRFQRALALRYRLTDKPQISFTDLTSMVIMQELRIADVLTADRHFQQVGLGFRLLPA